MSNGAFNVPNFGTINSGQSFPVGYTWHGQNMGAQIAEGHPENPGATLISDQQAIIMTDTGDINYQIQLTNPANSANTTYGLDGGGFSIM